MTVLALSLQTVRRLAVATSLIVALALPATGALAAPMHFGHHFKMGDGGMRPFNVDPDPCASPRFRAFGRGDCPNPPGQRRPRERHDGPRGPGSNAFGLQFDMGGY